MPKAEPKAEPYFRRLSPQDASFLYGETPAIHMHVAMVAIVEDPGLTQDEINQHIDERLNRVPRFRQKLLWTPLGQGRPVWVDDETFDVRFHVRHTGLARPGGERELMTLMGRLMSVQLDRSRPLWELWMVDLPRKRKAVIMKTHHALVDGVSGVDLASVLFDTEPDAHAPAPEKWVPRAAPSGVDLLRETFREGWAAQGQLLRTVKEAAQDPEKFFERAVDLGKAVGSFGRAGLESAPRTSLSGQIGPHRRFQVARAKLADVKAIKNHLGGTVNDVLLAVVSGALRHILLARGDEVEALTMRAAVPVSMRGANDEVTLGNRVAVMFADLPVGEADPRVRFERVRDQMATAKDQHQAAGADALIKVGDFAPPTLLSLGAQAIFARQWVMNLIVTNVPGPQFPLWFRGGRIVEFHPLAPLLGTTPVSIAILSYDGKLFFGLNGDWDLMADLDVLAEGIERSIRELAQSARGRGPRKPRARKRARPGAEA